jgi:hypothetical protein
MAVIQGKNVTYGTMVHYTDNTGMKHAALVKHVEPDPATGGYRAHLHQFHRTNGSDTHHENVPHSPMGMPHSWDHMDA